MKKIILTISVLMLILCSCKTSKNADCDAYGKNIDRDSTITYF